MIDDGKRAGKHGIPAGAAKVVAIELKDALRQDSYMNDLRIDLTHGIQGIAYVTDSSFGDDPALVVVDLATGKQRRVLPGHPSIVAQKDFVTQLDGVPMRYDGRNTAFPHGGVDGLALTPDSSRLFYSPLTSRHLWSLPTAALSDLRLDDRQLADEVKDEEEKVMVDGMNMDAQGRLYMTDAEPHPLPVEKPGTHIALLTIIPQMASKARALKP